MGNELERNGRSLASFYGTQTYAIDHKGRISVPASMRRSASAKKGGADTFFLVSGFEGCLALYAPEEWRRVEERLRQIPMGDRRGRAFARAFLMDATKVSVDAQGRIAIPPALMGRAGLGKEAVLLGQVDRIEIWNQERLNALVEVANSEYETLAGEVLGGKQP